MLIKIIKVTPLLRYNTTNRFPALTSEEDPELVRSEGHHGGLCGARLCAFGLEPQLHRGLVHFLQLTRAQGVVHPPRHALQAAHCKTA